MADLHYFPLMAGDWLAGEAVSMMTPEQEGAFIHLCCHAWQSKDVACSLPNDDKALAQLSRLGRRWMTAGKYVKEQFEPIEGNETRLRNPKLWAVYQDSVARHESRVRSGRAGGEAKAKAKQNPSNATGLLEQNGSNQNHNHNQNQKPPTTGGRLQAAEMLRAVRRLRNPAFPNSLLPESEAPGSFCDAERRVIAAVGVERILSTDPKNDGPLLAQVADMLKEVA